MNAARNYFRYGDAPNEDPTPLPPPPRLLVEWEPRWHAFCTALGPALRASDAPLEGECRAGAIHGRNSVLSLLLHLTALLVFISIPVHIVRSQQLLHADQTRQYEVLYYSGDELPQITRDAGGAQSGAMGRAGGRELFHPTQVIRVVRGNRAVDVVADAPRLKLPRTSDPIANLLTLPALDPGPPPVTSLRSRTAAVSALQSAPIPAPPEVRRQQLPQAPAMPVSFINAPSAQRIEISGLRPPELGTAHVVPPPVSAFPRETRDLSKLTLPAHVAVVPPPIVSREVSAIGVPGFGARQDIIPPPPQTSGAGNGSGGAVDRAMKSLRTLAGSGTARTGAGTGAGFAGGGVTAIVVSSTPGSAVGVPGSGGPGTLAMSPRGGSQPGLGGSGGGSGIGRGDGPGSGSHGAGPGSGLTGNGPGDGAVRPGNSPGPGPGGTGSGYETAALAGVTIVGGKVTIPGFSGPSSSSTGMSRSSSDARARPAITIIATARSGGALNTYGVFKGTKVYTIYIGTRIGMAVLQYAERVPGARGFEEDLAPPEPLASDFPADIKRARLLVSCVLDTSGTVKNLRVVESDTAADTERIMAALAAWRFRPVLRNNQPIEVDAMLGFNMDTR